MKNKSGVFLEALIEKLHGNRDLFKYCSDAWNSAHQSSASHVELVLPALLSPKYALNRVHFSWFMDYLKLFPSETVQAFLTVLTPTQSRGLSQQLNIPIKPIKLPYFSRLFLLSLLKQHLKDEEILPLSLIPTHPFNQLIDLPWKYLVHMIDLLGIYDLAAEMKVIIDNKVISHVRSALSIDQQKFLDYVSKTAIKWYSPKIGMKQLAGDPKILCSQIHQRGLIRFAHALRRLSESTKWHIIHKLDVGRAEVVKKTLKGPLDDKAIDILTHQMENVLGMMKK